MVLCVKIVIEFKQHNNRLLIQLESASGNRIKIGRLNAIPQRSLFVVTVHKQRALTGRHNFMTIFSESFYENSIR
jgi:hypothetical protein